MGIPDELLVDQRQISAALRCVICTEVFVEPVASGSNTCLEQTISCCFCLSNGRYADHLGLPWSTIEERTWMDKWSIFFLAWFHYIPLLRSCQHVFCLSCITRALANKAECPLCREEMHVLRLRRCQPLQALVDEVQVPDQLSWQSFHFWVLQKFRIPILGYPKIFHVWENDDQNPETSCHIFTQHVLKKGPAGSWFVFFLSWGIHQNWCVLRREWGNDPIHNYRFYGKHP